MIILLAISIILTAILLFCSFRFSFRVKNQKNITNLLIVAALFHIADFITRYFMNWSYNLSRGLFSYSDTSEYLHYVLTPYHILQKLIQVAVIVVLILCERNIIKLEVNKYLAIAFIGSSVYFAHLFFTFWWIDFSFLIIALISVCAAVLLWIKHSKSTIISLVAISSNALIFHRIISCLVTTDYYGFGDDWEVYQRIDMCNIFALIAFILTVIAIILVIKNSSLILQIPVRRSKHNTPEDELRLLNDKLQYGIISEEEYKAQRADIISKL